MQPASEYVRFAGGHPHLYQVMNGKERARRRARQTLGALLRGWRAGLPENGAHRRCGRCTPPRPPPRHARGKPPVTSNPRSSMSWCEPVSPAAARRRPIAGT
ncbi:hypothetical protein [Actinoplanes auranticolor]|uniref:Uncharacterized protein n=1 Tax=Actinoplanes auranticolor TaxID=47988 RepID=A0A919VQ91_9ACTN|nr:hypothetical protein [Actinoplanes auranticolor]GIM65151.1 hypothetical protein Aau02nite_15080 [Actinoplanes auranticolor]